MNPKIALSNFRQSGEVRSPREQFTGTNPPSNLVGPPRRFFSRYIIPAVLLGAFCAITIYRAWQLMTPVTPVRVVLPILSDYRVMTASQDSGSVTSNSNSQGLESATTTPLFQAVGWIEPYPFQRDISAHTAGIVRRIHVLEGDSVTPETIIAELVDEDAVIAIRNAEAELGLRKAELDAAVASRDNPLEFQGAMRQAKAELEQAEAEKKRVQQSLVIANRDSAVNKTLAMGGALGAFEAQTAVLEARLAELSVEEITAKINLAKANLISATDKLKLLVEENNRVLISQASVNKAQAALDEARHRYSLRRVKADTTGTIMILHVGEGATLSMDTATGLKVASLYNPDQLQIRADVPLAEVGKLRKGLPVEIRVDAIPDRLLRGEVTRWVHSADVQKNTLPVKVRLLETDPALKPEMIARLQFLSSSGSGDPSHQMTSIPSTGEMAPGSIFIPAFLAPDNSREANLWFVSASRTAYQRKVTLGPKGPNGLRPVLSGVQPPDKLIASNTEMLRVGSRVTITTSEDSQ